MNYTTEFGQDQGTLWTSSGVGIPLSELATAEKKQRRELRRRAKSLPIVWIVDDEQASRRWFVENHREHFSLITFSSRGHVVEALKKEVPCDIVVTDVFFPARTPTDQKEEQALLDIYDKIKATTIAQLPNLWSEVRPFWKLLGFDIAKDVAEWAARHERTIPVVLYSRKAPLLLSDQEWLDNPRTVKNTYWMTEKIDPAQQGDVVRKIASIQRNRIGALLSATQASASWWMKVLSGLGIKWGPFEYSLKSLGLGE